MTLRVLHVIGHSIPLHGGHAFGRLSILREQRRPGRETFHPMGLKQTGCRVGEESVDGRHFYRTPLRVAVGALRIPRLHEACLTRDLGCRLREVAARCRMFVADRFAAPTARREAPAIESAV